MHEARILRAAIEYFRIGGRQVDVLSRLPFSYGAEEYFNLPKKELTNWGSKIICFLGQYHCLDKPLLLWDIIAALLAFKGNDSIYVEQILIKWLSMSFLGSRMDLPAEKVLSKASSELSDISSRPLHLLNIVCRRVMLAELDADQINRIDNKLLNSGGPAFSKEKQITKWVEILPSSEMELRERLVGFSFSAFLTNLSYAEATSSHPVHWYLFGMALTKRWAELHQDNARDQLEVLVSEVTNEKRLLSNEHLAAERCSFCSASVPYESPEVGFCSGEDYSGGKGQRHRLLRCGTSMQVCPVAPLWLCICCRRSGFRLAPDALFRKSAYPLILNLPPTPLP
ncbi:uncharacterized protein LOC129294181 [Prosopis cineraria]|uniref:uncharacterized protein LOC129294181 n=1 Tax=Prosopis cineraria TaxID=364024 RepID=UPI00240F0518|nr:uncharacterized protein LOC129294181 [Prosopis cineraria]